MALRRTNANAMHEDQVREYTSTDLSTNPGLASDSYLHLLRSEAQCGMMVVSNVHTPTEVDSLCCCYTARNHCSCCCEGKIVVARHIPDMDCWSATVADGHNLHMSCLLATVANVRSFDTNRWGNVVEMVRCSLDMSSVQAIAAIARRRCRCMPAASVVAHHMAVWMMHMDLVDRTQSRMD